MMTGVEGAVTGECFLGGSRLDGGVRGRGDFASVARAAGQTKTIEPDGEHRLRRNRSASPRSLKKRLGPPRPAFLDVDLHDPAAEEAILPVARSLPRWTCPRSDGCKARAASSASSSARVRVKSRSTASRQCSRFSGGGSCRAIRGPPEPLEGPGRGVGARSQDLELFGDGDRGGHRRKGQGSAREGFRQEGIAFRVRTARHHGGHGETRRSEFSVPRALGEGFKRSGNHGTHKFFKKFIFFLLRRLRIQRMRLFRPNHFLPAAVAVVLILDSRAQAGPNPPRERSFRPVVPIKQNVRGGFDQMRTRRSGSRSRRRRSRTLRRSPPRLRSRPRIHGRSRNGSAPRKSPRPTCPRRRSRRPSRKEKPRLRPPKTPRRPKPRRIQNP